MVDSRVLPRLSTAAGAALLLLLGAGAAACGPAGGAPAPPLPPASPAAPVASAAPPAESPAPPDGSRVSWPEVDRLIDERRLAAALELVTGIRERAAAAGDEADWTRALVGEARLLTALHGYERSVRHLRATPWPRASLYRAVLDLYYARGLADYLEVYGWEIASRERVVSTGEVDLGSWTRAQIAAEIDAAYGRVWDEREAWGEAPLGELGEYFELNDYPRRIRGTLRDAVTYLWVAWLADSSRWSPAEEDEIHRLDLAALLAAAPGDAGAGSHPIAVLTARLADLEAWHRRGGRPEAAFEARLERLRRLRSAFSRAEERERIRGHLEESLEELGSGPEWWSVGQELLASWVRELEAPDSLVRARRIALAGLEAHPDSIGGRRCRHLVAEIEAPEYQLEAMTADGLDRRSLRVRHRNLAGLGFRAFRLDLLETVESARDRDLLPAFREVDELLARREPDVEWRVELPATPDYRLHDTYVTPPLELPGLWVVVASARPDFAGQDNRRSAVRMVVGEPVLLSRRLGDELEVTVRAGSSGAALAGAEVRLYRYDWRRGHRRVDARRTGEDGTARFAARGERGAYFAVALHGGEATVDPSYLDMSGRRPERSHRAALLYTDRSVYRPGQRLLWKAVAYGGRFAEGLYEVEPGTRLEVELRDANHEEVASVRVTTNEHGSASGEFTLPYGRLLGAWHLYVRDRAGVTVRVEEYKRPTFEVELEEPAEPLRLDRRARLTGTARYYFGLPVAGGGYVWRVTREPVWAHRRGWWWAPPPSEPLTVAAGAGELTADGSLTIGFTPEADGRLAAEGVSYRYRLSVEVTDPGGETRSAERVFRVGFVAVEARLDWERGFLAAGERGRVTVRRSDLDGAPRAGAGEWRLLEVAQPERALLPAEEPAPEAGEQEAPYRTPGDLLSPRWSRARPPEAVLAGWPDGRELARGRVDSAEDGEAVLELPPLDAGVYRLRYETRDPWGARFETARELVVAEPAATRLELPAVLLKERASVPVGETIRLLVHSGLARQEMVLEVLRGDQRIERRRLASSAGLQVVEIPVTAEHRGGLGLRLTAVRDHQLLGLVDSVHVPWDDRRLEISFATFRDRLRPGDRETWRVTVRGAGEEELAAGAAEILAYMYDRSLDLFAAHRPPSAADLYPVRGRPADVQVALGAGPEIWSRLDGWSERPAYPGLVGDRLVRLSGYGIGGPGGRGFPVGGVLMERMAMAVPDAAPESAAEEIVVTPTVADAGAPQRVGGPPGDGPAAPPPVELRTDFSESAFWRPHLVLGEAGAVAFEFDVPDSVTEWSVWVHALTRDLAGGSLERRARTVKELMVRPYLPRFLREGDRAAIRILVNNAGDEPLAGALELDLFDPESERSRLADFGLDPAAVAAVPFEVAPGGGAELEFRLAAPLGVGEVAVRAVARAGELSDGELRPLPLLPGRLHLAQSRFAALEGADRRELVFADLAAAAADPGLVHDQLVVTLDAQLFTSVLRALPYLVSFPYECTEQTLNRFVSTGILSSLYDDYPAVARLARELAARETRFEPWDAADPNRKMALEETPWRAPARGGPAGDGLIRVLDPRIADAQRRAALAELEKAQTALGGFPWWPGGPPSPYMTLYLLHGFAKAIEFGVEVPRPMVSRAWSYLHRHYLDEIADRMLEEECCWELVTFLGYVLSSYPGDDWTGGLFTADERRRMLDHSFSRWRDHSPLLKGYLALTLERAGRGAEARRVFDSVMDSARSDPDLGTYWAPEERAWLWYNDTVEGHAFALRTLTELDPDDARRHGLVQWLLLNKKLNHWKSTRATAEVLYALVHYLEREGALGVREEAAIAVGPRAWRMSFEPDELEPAIVERGAQPGAAGSGRANQIVIPGAEIDPPAMATVVIEKSTPSFLFASATWHFSTDRLPEAAAGDLLRVERRYFRRVHDGAEWLLEPLAEGAEIEVGDALEVELEIGARHAAEYVHLRDPRAAGFEPETLRSGYRWDLGLVRYEEVRDSGTNFFFERLPAGAYTLRYRLRAATAGAFRVGPATLQSMYAPEFTAYSSGARLRVE